MTPQFRLLNRIFVLFLISRLFFLLSAQVAPKIAPIDEGYLGKSVARGEPHFVWELANMDGEHFINIANLGYSKTNFAYFPLYPTAIGTISKFTGITPIYSGVMISIISTILAVFYLAKLTKYERDQSSHEALILLFFFPFSFILNSVYADALFLLLTTASFYYARRKNWWISGALAFGASLTRLSGLALFPALILEWWLQHNRPRINLKSAITWVRTGFIAPALNLAGFLTYTIFLQINYGNWRLFQVSMRAWKQEKFVFVLQVFFRYLKIFQTVSPNLLVYWVAILEFVSFILYFLLAIYVFKKIRASYGVFMMVLLLLVTFTGTFAGTPRYLVHLFPAYIGLAKILQDHPKARYIYYPVTIVLGIILTALFTQGRFVG